MYHVIDLKQTRGSKNRYSEGSKKIRGCRGLLGREVITFVLFLQHSIENFSKYKIQANSNYN